MNFGRVGAIAIAIFIGALQLLLTVHHVVKIRLGDTQEGWSVTFVISLLLTPLLMAFLIEAARKMKD